MSAGNRDAGHVSVQGMQRRSVAIIVVATAVGAVVVGGGLGCGGAGRGAAGRGGGAGGGGGAGEGREPVPGPVGAVAQAVAIDPSVAERSMAAAPVAWIAPHGSTIVGVSIDRTGTAAVTLDAIGGVRLWRRLDGTVPPVALAMPRVRAMEVAVQAGGFVVGWVDMSGAAQLVEVDGDGAVVATHAVATHGAAGAAAADGAHAAGAAAADGTHAARAAAADEAHAARAAAADEAHAAGAAAVGIVAVEADAWIVVRADHGVELIGRGGVRDRIARDGVRIAALRAMPGGALAIVQRVASGAYAAVEIGVAAGALVWGDEVELQVRPRVPVELAVAPDGRHAAYVADHLRVRVAAAAAEPRARRAPPGDAPERDVVSPVVIALDGPAPGGPGELADLVVDRGNRLGFSSAERLHVQGSHGRGFVVELGDVMLASPEQLEPMVAPAFGPGVIAGGWLQHLVVERPGGGGARYLGWAITHAGHAALSPDGAMVAWASGEQVVIEAVSGGGPTRRIAAAGEEVVLVAFADAAHVLVVTAAWEAQLYEVATGAVRGRVRVPDSQVDELRFHAGTGWLAGVHARNGAWALRVEPGSDVPLRAPRAIEDDSKQVWLLDGTGGEPAMVTFDIALGVRTYTEAQLAAGVTARQVRDAVEFLDERPLYVAGRGDVYVGGEELRRAADPSRVLPMRRVRDLAAAPDGTLVGVDVERLAFAIDARGAVRWARDVTRPRRIALSQDGRRAVVIADGGAQVLDVATGAVLATRCGWDFGAHASQLPGAAAETSLCE